MKRSFSAAVPVNPERRERRSPRATVKRRARIGAMLSARLCSSWESIRESALYRASGTASEATHTCTSSVISSSDVNYLDLCNSSRDGQPPHARSKVESFRTRCSGIHEELAPEPGYERAVRVAEYDDIGVVASRQFRGSWASDFVAVTDVHAETVDRNDELFSQFRVARRIGVAEDGFDRCNQSELVQNVGAADITRVKNELDSRQRLVNAGPKKSVRIGDESHHVRFGV